MKKIRLATFFLCLAVLSGILAIPVAGEVLYTYPEAECDRIESGSARLVYLGTTAADDVVPVSYTHLL